jgi:hypothetical protein
MGRIMRKRKQESRGEYEKQEEGRTEEKTNDNFVVCSSALQPGGSRFKARLLTVGFHGFLSPLQANVGTVLSNRPRTFHLSHPHIALSNEHNTGS